MTSLQTASIRKIGKSYSAINNNDPIGVQGKNGDIQLGYIDQDTKTWHPIVDVYFRCVPTEAKAGIISYIFAPTPYWPTQSTIALVQAMDDEVVAVTPLLFSSDWEYVEMSYATGFYYAGQDKTAAEIG